MQSWLFVFNITAHKKPGRDARGRLETSVMEEIRGIILAAALTVAAFVTTVCKPLSLSTLRHSGYSMRKRGR